jgi:hypothetical protein
MDPTIRFPAPGEGQPARNARGPLWRHLRRVVLAGSVTGAEIIARSAVTCPCCRVRIWLHDSAASFQNADRDLGQVLRGILK